MRILYMHQYFTTPTGVGGTRSYEFGRRFAASGHEVRVLTAARPREPLRQRVEDIEVVAVRGGYADYVQGTKLSYPRRVVMFARFALAATLAAVREPRPDVVYATSPPLTVGLPALVARLWHRAPLVFEVRDLWPEGPVQMGALRNPLLIRLLRGFELLLYRSAAHVIALSPGMRAGVLATGVPDGKVTLVPNASDLELFSPQRDGSEPRRRLGLGDRFVCTYFGTMGAANDLTTVIEAARLLKQRGDDDVVFVLHGDGKRRPELERLARERGTDNVVFSDPVPDKSSVARLAAASDACMTIYTNLPIFYTCSPNKLFDTFAAGRPAIVNMPGWQRELVEENSAGVYARPEDAEDLADKVTFLRDNPELVVSYGHNARRIAEQQFSRDLLAQRALDVLERAAAAR